MTLNHSKTWPVSTLAVVQLRVDPNGRTYSTQFDADANADDLVTDFKVSHQEHNLNKNIHNNTTKVEVDSMLLDKLPNGKSNGCVSGAATTINDKNEPEVSRNGVVLSHQHAELFSVQQERRNGDTARPSAIPRHPYKTTIRTDTVSTILEQEDIDNESLISVHQELDDKRPESTKHFEKFHVLALAKIEECKEPDRVRTPTVRVENWDLIYSEAANNGKAKLCPACTAAAANVSSPMENYKPKNSPNDYNDRLLVDLPLDARKTTTLRRHYYPEGGWGWVIITCTVLVHVLNVGLQLSCSQLAQSGAEKFKTTPVHIAVYDKMYKLILQDTAGQEDYDRLRPLGYATTDVFIVCYSIDREDSYKNVQSKWAREVRHFRPKCKIILVGTKVDMRDGRTRSLTFDDGLRLQSDIQAEDFYECSAKELYNVDNVFSAALIAAVKKPKMKKRHQFQCTLL